MAQKLKILILLTIIIAGAIGFTVFFDISSLWKAKEAKKPSDTTEVEEKIKLVPESAEDCSLLENEEKDLCFYVLAKDTGSEEICENISDKKNKEECLEQFVYNEIIKSADAQRCSDLEHLRDACYDVIFNSWEDIKKCDDFSGEIKNICQDLINSKKAYSAEDIDYCEEISDEALKENCKKTVASKPKDTDNDGVLDNHEALYGTNPQKEDTDDDGLNDLEELSKYFTDPREEDTDGDGYIDGDEVKNGYNPKGEGKL